MYLLALKEGKAFFLIGYRMYAFALAMHKGCVSHCLVKLQERKMKSLSRVWLWDLMDCVAHQAPHSWNSPGKNTGVDGQFLLQGIFWPRDGTCVSCTADGFLTTKPPEKLWNVSLILTIYPWGSYECSHFTELRSWDGGKRSSIL